MFYNCFFSFAHSIKYVVRKIPLPLPNTGLMHRKRNTYYIRVIIGVALIVFVLMQLHVFNYSKYLIYGHMFPFILQTRVLIPFLQYIQKVRCSSGKLFLLDYQHKSEFFISTKNIQIRLIFIFKHTNEKVFI